MEFVSFTELINEIHRKLGAAFISDFQYRRKELSGALRTAGRDKLFGNIHETDDGWWAINQGGGTEVQYHLSIEDDNLRYGLGFNALYVPFANDKPPVEHIRPFMSAFIKNEASILQMLPDYSFIIGNRAEMINPQNDRFTLFGKRTPITWQEDKVVLEDPQFDQIIQDLKRQLPAYELIFSQKQRDTKTMASIDEIINLLKTIKPQVILQGPPGTGKTFTAKDIAEKLITGGVSSTKEQQQDVLVKYEEQFKLIQFHPAYSYEDFVRGITAKANGNNIEYKTENKILAEFANTAFKNWIDSKKDSTVLTQERWNETLLDRFKESIQDEIDEHEKFALSPSAYIYEVDDTAFRYTGENWSTNFRLPFADILKLYELGITERKQIKVQPDVAGRAKQHATYYFNLLEKFRGFVGDKTRPESTVSKVEELKYVLIIDEINRANLPAVLGELIYALEYRGEPVSSMYGIEDDKKLILPPNLYIIGTMNTADRSVGHIDYAIRRRFAFVPVTPSDSVIDEVITDPAVRAKAKGLYQKVAAFFSPALLMGDFKQDDVQLGHSYFLAQSTAQLELKLEYEIKPLLREYLKDGILKSVRNDNDEDQTEIDINNLKVE